MLMFPRQPVRWNPALRGPDVRQVQRMGAPVVEVVAALHQPADSSLVHESNQPAGKDSKAPREGLRLTRLSSVRARRIPA